MVEDIFPNTERTVEWLNGIGSGPGRPSYPDQNQDVQSLL